MMAWISQDGSWIEFRKVDSGFDVCTRNDKGEAISTVVLPTDEARQMMLALSAGK